MKVRGQLHAETVLALIVKIETLVAGSSVNFPLYVEVSWNVMAHAQKPDFVFRRKGRVHLNRPGGGGGGGASVQSTTGSRGVRISGSNARYTVFRGRVKSTGYPLHSPVSPHFPSHTPPCVITFQLDSTYLVLLCILLVSYTLQDSEVCPPYIRSHELK